MNTLAELVGDTSIQSRLTQIAESVTQASDVGELQALLHAATLTLGAERSFFASFSGEGGQASLAFVLDRDASWWHRYVKEHSIECHPWLLYALKHSAPARATQLRSRGRDQQLAMEAAAAAGFASAILVPAHSGRLDNRASLLCLGHSVPGYFEDPAFNKLQVAARSLALELQAWWTNHERKRTSQNVRLSAADVNLLQRHSDGLSSKQIANELQVSCDSINSRFQRIIVKLGVPNRRAAARLAIECGFIVV